MDELDLNSDGFFDLEEFKSLSVKYESKFAESTIKEFDLDGDGFITRVMYLLSSSCPLPLFNI